MYGFTGLEQALVSSTYLQFLLFEFNTVIIWQLLLTIILQVIIPPVFLL